MLVQRRKGPPEPLEKVGRLPALIDVLQHERAVTDRQHLGYADRAGFAQRAQPLGLGLEHRGVGLRRLDEHLGTVGEADDRRIGDAAAANAFRCDRRAAAQFPEQWQVGRIYPGVIGLRRRNGRHLCGAEH